MLTVSAPILSDSCDGVVVSSSVVSAEAEHKLWYRLPSGSVSETADAFLAISLLPAMKMGLPLHIEGAVSPKLMNHLFTVQEIFHGWYPGLKMTAVDADSTTRGAMPGGEVGAFFTGGVDSFYTLLKHQDEIAGVIYVHGFDIWLKDEPLRRRVAAELKAIACEMGKPLVEVETNVREYTDRYLDWGTHAHGAALASVAHLLAPRFRKIYIPSSHRYGDGSAWGSHPLLDPLWSTESVEIVNDGWEATRTDKIKQIAGSRIALGKLRVCYENLNGAHDGVRDFYNCGMCEKCLRTMINLHLAGVLERCATFPGTLDLKAVAGIELDDATLSFAQDNLRAAREKGDSDPLVRALESAIQKFKFKRLEQELTENFQAFERSEWWRQWIGSKKNSIFKLLWGDHRNWLIGAVLIEALKRLDGKIFHGVLHKLYKTLRIRSAEARLWARCRKTAG
jgi:hypothetical protein